MTHYFEDEIPSSLQAVGPDQRPAGRPVPPRDPEPTPVRRSGWRWPALVGAAVVAIVTTFVLTREHGTPAVTMPTMTSGCVSGWPDSGLVPPVSNTWFAANDTVLPSDTPTSATVCIYADPIPPEPDDPGFPPALQVQPVRLTKSKTLSAKNAAVLARTINAIGPVPEQESSCPPGEPAFTVVAFQYPAARTAVLLYQSSACQSITNGRSTRYETANPTFYNQFMATASQLGLR